MDFEDDCELCERNAFNGTEVYAAARTTCRNRCILRSQMSASRFSFLAIEYCYSREVNCDRGEEVSEVAVIPFRYC